MGRQHQDPSGLTGALDAVFSAEDVAILKEPTEAPVTGLRQCGRRLADVLLRYCSYSDAQDSSKPDPFDDPFVGAALLTSNGDLLGSHRKEGRNEPHAEVEALLQALEASGDVEALRIGREIRNGLDAKVWLVSEPSRLKFVQLFADAGNIVRGRIGGSGKRLILVSTLEPCRDFEAQPSCSALIAAFRPSLVVYACDDTNAKGQGRDLLLNEGIKVVPNVSPQFNIQVNLLFYATVHYLGRLHQAALEADHPFDTNYIVASLNRLAPTYVEEAKTGRLRVVFDNPIQLPVHPASMEGRAPQTYSDFSFYRRAVDPNRVLFINSQSPDFLELYLQRHFESTDCIPGIIVCPQANNSTVDSLARPAAQSQLDTIIVGLRQAGVRVYTNVLRKTDEQFLGLHSVLRLKESPLPEGQLYVFAKEEQDRYTATSGPAEQVAALLLSLRAPLRVSIYFGEQEIRPLKALLRLLQGSKAFDQNNALARASFQICLVSKDDAPIAFQEVTNFVHQQGLGSRCLVQRVKSPQINHDIHELRREMANGRMDPIGHDFWFDSGIVSSMDWKDRQAAGLLLADAAKQDPLLYVTRIASRIPARIELAQWREILTLLNAIKEFGRPLDQGDADTIMKRLCGFAQGLEDLLVQSPEAPQVLDLIWRYMAASLAVANGAEETRLLLGGPKLTAHIGGNSFLLKELFFYASTIPETRGPALALAFDILERRHSTLSLDSLGQVFIRIVRLSSFWNNIDDKNAFARLTALLIKRSEFGPSCSLESESCKRILGGGLSTVFTWPDGSKRPFGTYLFLRAAAGNKHQRGLHVAVAQEFRRRLAARRSADLKMSWRGDHTALARLVLSEVDVSNVLAYLGEMADDEDDSVKWAALVLAMDFEMRTRLLGPNPTKRACIDLRHEISLILSKIFASEPHYWLVREAVNLFEIEHSPGNLLPFPARLQIIDIPIIRKLVRSPDSKSLHPEIVAKLRRLGQHQRRIALVLPPVNRVGEGQPSGRKTTTPPLGLGSIATYLMSRGHDAEILDCHRFPELTDNLPALLRGFDLVGFNVVTSTFSVTENLVGELRTALGAKAPIIVLGGHAVTLHTRDFVEHKRFDWDYLVLGDGEEPLLRIVEGSLSATEIEHSGVIHKGARTVLPRSTALARADWDAMPWVDHRIYLDPKAQPYEPIPSRNGKCIEAHIVMSRGCAWKCSFCTEAILRGKDGEVRRSAEDVVAEIRCLVETEDVNRVQFIDDNLLPQIAARGTDSIAGLQWANALLGGLEAVVATNPQFGWRGIFRFEDFIAYENSIPNWLVRLRNSGCQLLAFGVEHGLEERRFKMKGGSVSNAEITRIVGALSAQGIATKGYFMVGGPDETNESVNHSIHLAISAGFTLAYFALYKNFRELIARSERGAGTVEQRQSTFMRFRTLLADFGTRLEQCQSTEDSMESFGIGYDAARLAEARETLHELRSYGFSFDDLFKYNDFHDSLDDVNTEVRVWGDHVNIEESFLRAVRRAYFEFYTRKAFVMKYKMLVDGGY